MKANHASYVGKRLNVLKYIMFLAICVIAIAAVTIPAFASAAVNNQNAKAKVEVTEDQTFDAALAENAKSGNQDKVVPANDTSITFKFFQGEGETTPITYDTLFDKFAASGDTIFTPSGDRYSCSWTSDKFISDYTTLSVEDGSYVNDGRSTGVKFNLKTSSLSDPVYYVGLRKGISVDKNTCKVIDYVVNGAAVDDYNLGNITINPNIENVVELHISNNAKLVACYFPKMTEPFINTLPDWMDFADIEQDINADSYIKAYGCCQVIGKTYPPRGSLNVSSWMNICVKNNNENIYIISETDNENRDEENTSWTKQTFIFCDGNFQDRNNEVGRVEITLKNDRYGYICENATSCIMPNMYTGVNGDDRFGSALEFGGLLKDYQAIVFEIAATPSEVAMMIDTSTVKSAEAAASASVKVTRHCFQGFDSFKEQDTSVHYIDSNAPFSTVLPKNYDNSDNYQWKLTWNDDDTLTLSHENNCVPENFYNSEKGTYTFEAKSPTANDDVVFSGWRIFDNYQRGEERLDQSSIGGRGYYINKNSKNGNNISNTSTGWEFQKGDTIYIDRNIDIYAIFSSAVTVTGQVYKEKELNPGKFEGLNGVKVAWTDKDKGEKQEKFAYVGVDNLDASDNDVVNIQTEDTSKYKDSVGDGYYELHIPWDVEGEVFIDPAQDGIKDYLAAGYMLDMVKTQITESTSKVDLYLMLGKRVNINTQGKGTFSQFYYVNGGSTPIPGPQDTDEFFFGMDENGVLYLERQTEPDNKLVLHYYNEFKDISGNDNTVDVIWEPVDNDDYMLRYFTINGKYMQEGVDYKVDDPEFETPVVEIVPHYVGFANVTFIPINCFLSCSYQVGETDPVYYSIYDNSSDRLYEDGKVLYYGAPMFTINWDTPVPESEYVISESGTAFVIPYYNCEFQGITVNGMPLMPGFTLEAGKHYDIFIYCKSQTPEPPVPPTPPVPPEPPTPPTPPTPPIPPEPVPPTPVPPVPVPPTPVDPGTGAQTGDVNGVNVIVLLGLLVVASSVVCFRNRKKFN